MSHQNKDPKQNLEQAIAAMRADVPDQAMMQAAGERAWQHISEARSAATSHASVQAIRSCEDVRLLLPEYRDGKLSSARALLVEDHLHECVECRREAESGKRGLAALSPWRQELPKVQNGGYRWAAALAAVLLIGIAIPLVRSWFFSGPAGMRARVETMQGVVYGLGHGGEHALKVGDELGEGELVRTAGGSQARLRLRDGSLVEMNERAQFAVSIGYRDTTLNLDRGNIIVQAAKRASGHLYVAAKDCRVSVTGTVFAVNSGIKGSRVSVIEGEVRVADGVATSVLHPGEQLSTNAALGTVPVREEIAWSKDLDKHLALLAEFAHLSNKLDTVKLPGLRYQSHLLPLLPANTVFYAALPNLGDAAQQANQLFQQELEESAVLREWWQQVQSQKHGPNFNELIEYVHDLGQYLGDEIVFSVALDGERGAPLVVAQVQRPGLKQFIEQELAKYQESGKSHIQVVEPKDLGTVKQAGRHDGLLVLVRPDFVVASPDAAALQRFNASLDSGNTGFAGTGFGQRMTAAYQKGAEFLLAADLKRMTAGHLEESAEHNNRFQQTGLADVEYLVAERKDVGGLPNNRAELTFKGQRQGLASWLAAPAPIGGLDYISRDAGAVAAFVSKRPADMLDDILKISSGENGNASAEIAKGESELKIRFHQDLADTLGGEITMALDGPILPTPSWKVIVEVNGPGRLQSTIEQLIADANEHIKPPEKGVALEQETAGGRTFYTVRSLDATKQVSVTYTFTDGYMIMAPSRALIMNSIAVHQNGNSLAQSDGFRALLPQDEHADVSAVLYQNLSPVVQPIVSQLSASQLQSLRQLAAETKPSAVCAYGENNAIRVASNSKLFGLDLNTLALSALMDVAHPGAASRRVR